MKKRYKIALVILVVLIGIRIYLPYGVTKYVNKTLKNLPGYTGSISDVDIHLYRGAYVIDSLKILQEDSSSYVPFFSSDRIDLSLQWKAILNGSVVGELSFFKPELNFIAAEDTSNAQYGEDVDWTKPIKELMPLKINQLTVEKGDVHFMNFESDPEIDLFLKNLNIVATNLSNSTDSDNPLPSHLEASAVSIGGGNLSLNGDLNLLMEIPNMDLNLDFEGVDLTALNAFLKAYGGLDAEEGTFNLYSEIAINDGLIDGYVKPVINDLKIIEWSKDKKKPLQLIWESIAGVFLELFENQPNDQLATKVQFSGDLNSPDTPIIPTIWNVFSNAFLGAFSKDTDDTVDFSSVSDENK